ncbi:universal stress protein [Haloarculaceae archaeon H-GB2-1]|nr:universal stress protein [Haloarculaceae archaeon H-GB1-1]MEA5386566.1 universal stress protein [Haloarculaceae archaeon H-GB11]MEA5408083.1 universal stress protein [Haloarculaceae archaeon H-GB2-1]
MNMETVLLALDSTDDERLYELVDTAANVAGPADATVVLLHVFDRDEYESLQHRLGIDPSSETTPSDVAKRYETVKTVADALEARGIEVEIRGALGDEGDSIVRVAGTVGADMVVVGGRKRSPTGKAVFGSVAQRVMLNSPCPVTFVKASDVEIAPSETPELRA